MVRILCRACRGTHCAAVRAAGKNQPEAAIRALGAAADSAARAGFCRAERGKRGKSRPGGGAPCFISGAAHRTAGFAGGSCGTGRSAVGSRKIRGAGGGWYSRRHGRPEKSTAHGLALRRGGGILLVSAQHPRRRPAPRPCGKAPPPFRRCRRP